MISKYLTCFRRCPVGVLVSPQSPPHHSRRRTSGTRPHRGSCRCCWEWAWCRSPAGLRWPSGWSGPLMWSGWWPSPGDQTSLRAREYVEYKKFTTNYFHLASWKVSKDYCSEKQTGQMDVHHDCALQSSSKSCFQTSFHKWDSKAWI